VNWRPALRVAAWAFVLSLAAVVPASFGWCLGNRSRWPAAVAGCFGNFWPLLLAVYACLTALQRWSTLRLATLGVLLVLGTLGTVACVEFALQRGAPLAPLDVANGLDVGFIRSELPVLMSPRFGPFLAVSVVALVYGLRCLHHVTREARSGGFAHQLRVGLLVAVLCLSTVPVRATARGDFASRPYAALLGAVMSVNGHNAITGVEDALLRLSCKEDDALRGMPMLGLRAERCGGELRVGEPLASPGEEDARLPGWKALAQELGASGRPLALTFVLLESVGAEDVSGLSASAPPHLTPYLDSLLTAPNALPMRGLFQAGQRTAFAMSALLCGVGTSPGLYAPLRDLPHLNLRCWTDLAGEAGMDVRFFYGEDLSFDRYDETLRGHGFNYLHAANLTGRKRGGWGLSDRELFVDVLEDQRAQGKNARGVVRGLLTLSTHAPYTLPEDMPAEHVAKARALARQRSDDGDIVEHWTTVSYLDDALSRFVPRLMEADLEQGRAPVVVLVGDHSSGLRIGDDPLNRARIPGIWLFPPFATPSSLDALRRELGERPWSQNDLARLALQLLRDAGQLDSLPESSRWHSLGGQALGHFTAPEPYRPARIWTLDTLARTRLIDASGRVLVEEPLESPRVLEDLTRGNVGKEATLALSWLVAHPSARGACPR
jgi:hypothetical protein